MNQGAAQAELLLHAAREFLGRAISKRQHARAGEQGVDALLAFGLVLSEQAPEKVDILED